MILHLKIKGHHDISTYLNNFILILLFNTSLATMGAFAHPLQNRTYYRMPQRDSKIVDQIWKGVYPCFVSPRPKFPESQFWDRVQDWNFLSLNFETTSKTGIFQVEILRPEYYFWVLILRLSPRYGMVRYCNLEFILFKIKSETRFFWSWL